MPAPNPTNPCGAVACDGGADCGVCSDGMPPAFLLSADVQNDQCSQCTEIDGVVLLQDAYSPCRYEKYQEICGSDPAQQVVFSEYGVDATLDTGMSDAAFYSAPPSVLEDCNRPIVLQRTSVSGSGQCFWPEDIRITPCDANGNTAPACNDTVQIACCSNALPKTLTATLQGADDCDPCMDGDMLLEWDPSNEYWVGTKEITDCDAGTFTLEVRFGCIDNELKQWRDVRGGDCGSWSPFWSGDSNASCDPLQHEVYTSLGGCCGSGSTGLTIVITE